jgi:hypothetical protein
MNATGSRRHGESESAIETEAALDQTEPEVGRQAQDHAEAQSRCSEGESQKGRPALSEPRRQHGRRTEDIVMAAARKRAATKDPRGGLTAAGRRAFKAKTGANLKPGVKTSGAAMSVEDMRRKGSWAVRFYGRKGKLPPLRDEDGKPTRFALTAHAWGEPVPKTAKDARAIATRGRALLRKAEQAS